MGSTKNFCSSSLWTCLHHMVILISQNKNHRFFYDFSLSMSLQRVKDRDNHGNLDIQSVPGLLLTRPCSLTRTLAHIYQNCYFFFSPRHNRPAQNHSDHSPHIDVAQVNPRCISVCKRHVFTETAHFEQFCCIPTVSL